MPTVIRPEVSKKNKYWIPRNRFYELKHFCLQYPEWKKAYSDTKYISATSYDDTRVTNSGYGDPTYKLAEERILYFNKMLAVEKAAKETDPELDNYILRGVTEGLSYNYLFTQLNIPCSRNGYYTKYRKFFWILNKYRD